jgi:hypothetical protein
MNDYFTVNELVRNLESILKQSTGGYGLKESLPSKLEGLGGLRKRILDG